MKHNSLGLGDIHRLAAGVDFLAADAIERSNGEARDADVVVDRRIQADGGDSQGKTHQPQPRWTVAQPGRR